MAAGEGAEEVKSREGEGEGEGEGGGEEGEGVGQDGEGKRPIRCTALRMPLARWSVGTPMPSMLNNDGLKRRRIAQRSETLLCPTQPRHKLYVWCGGHCHE